MPVRIYDIAKKLGIESKEVLAKAKELGIAAKVPSSSLDKITGEYLEQNNWPPACRRRRRHPPPPASAAAEHHRRRRRHRAADAWNCPRPPEPLPSCRNPCCACARPAWRQAASRPCRTPGAVARTIRRRRPGNPRLPPTAAPPPVLIVRISTRDRAAASPQAATAAARAEAGRKSRLCATAAQTRPRPAPEKAATRAQSQPARTDFRGRGDIRSVRGGAPAAPGAPTSTAKERPPRSRRPKRARRRRRRPGRRTKLSPPPRAS